MKYAYLICSILFVIIGILFLIWGIHQINTGKMVANFSKKPIDEPREVGVMFLLFGPLLLIFALSTFFQFLTTSESLEMIVSICILCWLLLFLLALIIFAIFGLVKKRIFTIKTSVKTKKLIKKYYIPTNASLIFAALSFASMLACFFVNMSVSWIFLILFTAASFINVFCLVTIQQKSAKNS